VYEYQSAPEEREKRFKESGAGGMRESKMETETCVGEYFVRRRDPARTSLQPAAWHRMVVTSAQPLGRGVMPPVDLPDGHLSAQFSTVPSPTSVLVHRPVSSIATRMRLASHDTCARSHAAGASPGNASGSPIASHGATVSTACAALPLAERIGVQVGVFINPLY